MTPWYRDRAALRLIATRYVPLLAALSLAWELAQLPLYTIWTEASPGYRAFAVAHCTLGDVLIGTACLAIALLAGREPALPRWHWARTAILTVVLGVSYTVFSEWMNTTLGRWSYADAMPTIGFGALRVGLSPLAQWLIVPALALWLARR